MIPLFTLATLLSAALLFAVQPMAAKMALPLLGGSAGVWTTCMLFFQTGLLAGYGWAHLLGRRFAPRTQVILHGALALTALFALPPVIGASHLPPVDASPVPWLLLALATSFGLPYAALAATGPLLQRWFSSTGHARADDPYFLYAASNAGSFVGLVGYPLVIERMLPLRAAAGHSSQAGIWSIGFVALAVMIVAAGAQAARRPAPLRAVDEATSAIPASWGSRLRWMALAFVPSSAVLGVTQYLTSDIAAIPLFWIVPLGLYLLTFVVAFSPRVRLPFPALGIVLGVLSVGVAAEFHGGSHVIGPAIFAVHLAALVAVGLLCHGRLAAVRPDRSQLTEYYLWIAFGGCLGGVFNAIAAPLLFNSIAEYPIALALAAFFVPDPSRRDGTARARASALALDAAAAFAVGASVLLVERLTPTSDLAFRWLGAIRVGVPALLALAILGWPRRFAFALAALLGVTWGSAHTGWSALHRDRTFYGVHKVVEATSPGLQVVDAAGKSAMVFQRLHVLVDGVTRHGSQALEPERRRTPTTYYHPSGPLGDVFRGLRARGSVTDVGLIGLGAGSAAAYGEAGERFTYFEIDPAVARIARDPAFFTYLTDSRAQVDVVLGDGRRRLAECADGRFDLIVLDAFSSDAIPVHLLTREALSMYLRKLKPGGCVALHLTNGYVALEPVVTAIARELRVPAAFKEDKTRTPEQAFEGKDLSRWAVMGREAGDTLPVHDEDGWIPARPGDGPDARRFLWTDDRSNLIGLLRRR